MPSTTPTPFRAALLALPAILLGGFGASEPLWAFEEQIDTLAVALGERISAEGKETVAVVDFVDVRGNTNELGRFLAEEVSVALLASPQGFQLVDRAHLNRIMEEAKLGESGIVDPDTAKELGRIAGVDALVTGTLTPLEGSVRLTAKVLETETANVIAGERVSLSSTGPIRELLARGLSSPAPSPPPAGAHTRAYEMASHEAGGLRLTVKAIRILHNGRVAALIDVSNLEAHPLRIGLAGGNQYASQAMDNNGNLFEQIRGLTGSFRCTHDSGLSLAPNESQQITELYRSVRDAEGLQVGDVFQVTVQLRICKPQEKDHRDGKTVQFSFADLPADSLPAQ